MDMLSLALSKAGFNGLASSLLRWGIHKFPDHESMFYSDQASIFERTGQFDEAVRCLKRAIQKGPDSEFYHWELAIMYEKHGEFDLALVNFERSLDLGTDFGEEFRAVLHAKIEQLKHAH